MGDLEWREANEDERDSFLNELEFENEFCIMKLFNLKLFKQNIIY